MVHVSGIRCVRSARDSRTTCTAPASLLRRSDPRCGTIRAKAVADRSKGVIIPPYNVLITGGSKGIGRALAERFLASGDNVVICSRTSSAVESAVADMAATYTATGRIHGIPCDIARADDVEALAAFAQAKMSGSIDIWINNAGSNAYSYTNLSESDANDLEEIVATNVLGSLICCRQAIRSMREQPAGGHIMLMDGAGSTGSPTPRFAAYGATKRSLGQMISSVNAELAKDGLSDKICAHNLSPGMVTTELLMSGADTPQAKWFINCLAEKPETVAEYLVPLVRELPGTPLRAQDIRFLTGAGAVKRILSRILLETNRNRWVPEDGNSRLPIF